MPKISKVSDSVWKLRLESNVYFIDGPKKIIIDTGPRNQNADLTNLLGKVVDFDKVEMVFFTHLHYDHIGNFDKFQNATFHASREEIRQLKVDSYNTILDKFMAEKIEEIKSRITPFPALNWLEIIDTPGHTSGSVCIWMPSEKVLFTGDTLFDNCNGRVDLPTSVPNMMQKSIVKLVKYNFKVFCPGHDY